MSLETVEPAQLLLTFIPLFLWGWPNDVGIAA
jgi:hypothetical protein